MFKKYKLYFNFLPLIILTIILVKIVFNVELVFSNVFLKLFSIMLPFFWGLGIAYLINPLMIYFEKKFKVKRVFSLIISYIIVIILIYIGVVVIFPSILNSIVDLVKNISSYADTAQVWILDLIENTNTDTVSYQLQSSLTDMISKISSLISNIFSGVLSQTLKFTSSFVKFIFGFLISIYMLMDKETIINGCKKVIIALFPSEKRAREFLSFMSEANDVFGRFIIGKTIDSIIIGLICYIGLLFIKTPYAALIALIVGITNMIPYFGPFIGMVPAFILVLLVKPTLAIWVLLFIFLLQQFDGWYLGPKILGEKVGVSPLAIIFAVTLGGGLFGVIGMFLSVPIIALVKIYGSKYLEFRLGLKSNGIKENYK